MIDHLHVRPDIVIFVLALVLYVIDLGRLIYANEILFYGSGKSRWRVATPADGFLFSRRFALFPRPFDPGNIVVSLAWPTAGQSARNQNLRACIATTMLELTYPRVACRLLLPQLFLVLPGVYLLPKNDLPVLLVLLAIYIQIIALTVWLFRVRRRLSLPIRKCLLWAFESLVCIPYAANFHRKIAAFALSREMHDAIHAAAELLPAPVQRELADYLREAIRSAQQSGVADEARATALREFQIRVAEELGRA